MNHNFSEKKWTWEDEYLISSYEVDARGRMPLPTLGKFMQETAYNHANHLGFGYEQLKEQGLFWVLARLLVTIHKYPRWDDKIRVRTWPSGIEGLFAYRDFKVLDAQDQPIAVASSAWLMLDAEKHRPQRQELLKERNGFFPVERSLPRRPAKIPPLTAPTVDEPFPVRYSDLDLYDHVNNAKYMQWLLDSYPEKILRQNEIATFEINFAAEAKMGDEVVIHTE
ncbi:MAG TPA: acyl-ACP thioesterase domain-containing protein, partial [Candidatus Kapabacteria bacterium]|nr:acyl-ACP thioesterase domain-containing protein [Candidatus Kapabacteria bacterium]